MICDGSVFMLNSSVTAYMHLSEDPFQLAKASMRREPNIGCRCRVMVEQIKPVFVDNSKQLLSLPSSFLL